MDMERASEEEIQRIQGLIDQAKELFDDHWTKLYAEHPGWVCQWGNLASGAEPKQVPLEVWFYLRGTLLGLGEADLRRQREES